MKRILLSASLFFIGIGTYAQNQFTENFDVFANLATNGWVQTNQSSPVGAATWAQGGGTAFATGGYNGGPTSFALVNYTSTTGVGTISNWLITPVITLENDDVITFWSRQGGLAPSFADRLELRISTNGAATMNPSGGSAGLGDFTTLALTINPNLEQAGYPLVWTQYSYTVSGLSGPTPSKIAFRYFVTNGGPDGANSNIIGIDAFSVDRTLSRDEFMKQNFTMYPNPANKVLNIASTNGITMTSATITDVNGRTVVQQSLDNLSSAGIDVSVLTSGVYFISVDSAEGKGTAKFVKN